MSQSRKRKRPPKHILALPDLEQSKAAVLNSLTSKSGQRSYDRAITDFVEWYCSEPRSICGSRPPTYWARLGTPEPSRSRERPANSKVR